MTCAIHEPVADWSVTTELMPHQPPAVAKMLPTRVGGLFMPMGTGKSLTAIMLAWLRREKIDRVVWFTPVSVKETVRHQIVEHTNCGQIAVHVFDDRTSEATVPSGALWYVVGIESMSSCARVVLTVNQLVTDRTMVIVDESSYIKGHRATRTERITHIAARARYRLLLTGTPITQGAVDLFSQMRFLHPKILGYRSFYSFARNHLEYSDRYKGKIDRVLNTEFLASKIAPYVYQVTQEECVELPPKRYEHRWCSMTDEQWEAYEAAKVRFAEDVMRYDTGSQWESSIPIFRLFSALQSIVCGFVKVDGVTLDLPNNRPSTLLHAVREIPPSDQVVIWAKYRRPAEEIAAALEREHGGGSVVQFHGRVSQRCRSGAMGRWRGGARFFVATQALGSHGLNDLITAPWAIFYANGFKYSERLQAEARSHRIGQERLVAYVDIWADAKIDGRIRQSLEKKGNAVEEFRREVEAVKGKNRKERLIEMVMAL